VSSIIDISGNFDIPPFRHNHKMMCLRFVSFAILGAMIAPVSLANPIWARQGSLNGSEEIYCGKLTDPVFFTRMQPTALKYI
jgi:hypothetical protein